MLALCWRRHRDPQFHKLLNHCHISLEAQNVSEDVLDPVKEFKFLVIGHEFDHYPKKMIRDIRNWDWFLEEHKEEDSDEDEVSDRKLKKGKRRKRKKGGANDDEDDDVWTGESEEDAELIKKLKNDNKPKYSTRSKDQKKSKKGASTSKSGKDTTKSYAMDVDVEDDDDDETDETLGGFIVDDEDVGEAIDEDVDEETDEDDEEEEFEEDEDDE
ncbi:hypothetical protein Tco_1110838 [Tanacetum coccineum]|uniref:FACT complex subunit n=1 Tax=Tanacetum coccineum TaxID=301880 RepID=A0ABQ5ILE9_9ASTR